MKKGIICIMCMFISLLFVNNIWGDQDNIFVGMDTVDELDDLGFIAQEANITEFEDGEITVEDLDFSRINKIFVDTLPYFFNEQEIRADSLKALINGSDYVYYMPIYREHETIFLTIAKGQELSPDADLSEEGIAYIQERAGRWCVSEVGRADEVMDPAADYMGLMESYLDLRDIHDAEIYFVSRINPESVINAVCFTGDKTETGDDELIFVAVDKLKYDESGNLVVDDAEYTYEELWEMNEKLDLNPEYSGGSSMQSHNNIGVYITIAAGILLIVIIVLMIIRKNYNKS